MATTNSSAIPRLKRLQGRNNKDGQNTVLVVEDSKSILSLLCAYLDRLEGINVISATSMAEAEALLTEHGQQIFCAVLDLNLPDAPNGEVVDLVQGHGIPVVVLTGSVDESLRKMMLEKNIVKYVVKRHTTELENVTYIVGRIFENQDIKILIVDDSPSFRSYLISLLDTYRYSTLTAGNGKEALKVLKQHPDISLVITDYNMPEMNGLELIEAIRLDYRREELAVIGVTDVTKPGVSVRLLQSGANDFLSKPFEIEELYCRVTQNTNMIGYVREIRDLATRDYLTKVYNRRHLFDMGEVLYANAKRGNVILAAALIDADHFKAINDTYGHHIGDQALIALAGALTSSLRTSDIVSRYGGEEFACLAIIKKEDDAVLTFERARKRVEDIELYVEGERVRIAVSIGVTTKLAGSLDEMLQLADSAVYEAKNNGRNRVVSYDVLNDTAEESSQVGGEIELF